MKPTIDTHCHFINFSYLPDKYTTHLLGNKSKILARIMHEDDFQDPDSMEIMLIKIAQKLGLSYVEKFLNSLRIKNYWGEYGVIDTLVKKGEYFTRNDFDRLKITHDNYRKTNLFTPLMMDFIQGAQISNIQSRDGVTPFLLQWYEHILLARTYPWKVMPFFHFHPCRKHVHQICDEAINNFGFIGIKMYPAMGFYPDCNDARNDIIDANINKNLEWLYSHLKKWKDEDGVVVPITVHCQFSSTQAIDCSMDKAMEFTKVENWKRVIEDYDLKINFAHYGGNEYLDLKPSNSERQRTINKFSEHCRKDIRALMRKYNKNGEKRIFADTAAHGEAFQKHSEDYFDNLKDDLASDNYLVMFGTDMPVITPDMLNKDYIKAYEEGISDDVLIQKFFTENALDFLFDNRIISKKYIEFLATSQKAGFLDNNPLDGDLEPWVIPVDEENKIYKVY